MAMNLAKEKKSRTVNEKSEYQKNLKSVRGKLPTSILEVEIVSSRDTFTSSKTRNEKTIRSDAAIKHVLSVSEHMRVIRNTVLGELFKNYEQMVRTNEYKRLIKEYKAFSERLETLGKKKALSNSEKILGSELSGKRKIVGASIEDMKFRFNVTKAFAMDYASMLRKTKYSKPDAVLALKCADRAWLAMERIMFGDAKSPRFLKRDELPSLEGKQAERCLILRHDKEKFSLKFGKLSFNLLIKKNDIFVEETLNLVMRYMENAETIDKENVESYLNGKKLKSTYRIKYNRIVIREIRSRKRLFLQICIEGEPLPKRNKDNSFRHKLGTGRVGIDIGTQSQAVASKDAVMLKNLAERSAKSLKLERKVKLLQRKLTRSRIANNPSFFNEDGTCKKRSERPVDAEWHESKAYKKLKSKLRNMHRVAADSRKYAVHEDVNRIRTLGDTLITETMNIKSLQKRAKETTVNAKTGKFNCKKRFGKSIQKRCPGYFIDRLKYKFALTGGTYSEVNTYSFKASQYDHILDASSKKQLSQRWHILPDGRKVQRDCYSAMLLYCSNDALDSPDTEMCNSYFEQFYNMHNNCIEHIAKNNIKVMNSGIKFSAK